MVELYFILVNITLFLEVGQSKKDAVMSETGLLARRRDSRAFPKILEHAGLRCSILFNSCFHSTAVDCATVGVGTGSRLCSYR